MEQLKERLVVLLDKEKVLNKPHAGSNSYHKTQNNDNSFLKHPSHQLPITPIINKNQNINIETNISEKL